MSIFSQWCMIFIPIPLGDIFGSTCIFLSGPRPPRMSEWFLRGEHRAGGQCKCEMQASDPSVNPIAHLSSCRCVRVFFP
jgi:hypothetical protein